MVNKSSNQITLCKNKLLFLKGNCGEETAKKFQITRQEQDEFGRITFFNLE